MSEATSVVIETVGILFVIYLIFLVAKEAVYRNRALGCVMLVIYLIVLAIGSMIIVPHLLGRIT